jgi:hypothetical protein
MKKFCLSKTDLDEKSGLQYVSDYNRYTGIDILLGSQSRSEEGSLESARV